MTENTKQQQIQVIRKDGLGHPISSFIIGIGMLGFTSYKYYKFLPHYLKSDKYFQNLLGIKNIITTKDAPLNSVVYGQGKLKYDRSRPIRDILFGVSSMTKETPGLYRKIEVYQNLRNKQDWYNVNYLSEVAIPKEIKSLKSKVLINGNVYMEEYKLSNYLLQIFAECYNQQLTLNPEEIKKYYESIIDQQTSRMPNEDKQTQEIQEESKEIERNLSEQLIQEPIQVHPFKLSQESKKVIEFVDNHIYIVNTLEEITEGDIRISFYGIENIEEISVIASRNQENSLSEFLVPELAESNEIILVKFEENKFHFKVGNIGFIMKGNVKENKLVNEFMYAVKEVKIPEFIMIYIILFLYFYITDKFFKNFNIREDEEDLRQMVKQMIKKESETKIVVEQKPASQMIIDIHSIILGLIHFLTQRNLYNGIHRLPSIAAILLSGAYLTFELSKMIQLRQILHEEINNTQQEMLDKLLNKKKEQS